MEENIKKHIAMFIAIALPIIAAILMGYVSIGPK